MFIYFKAHYWKIQCKYCNTSNHTGTSTNKFQISDHWYFADNIFAFLMFSVPSFQHPFKQRTTLCDSKLQTTVILFLKAFLLSVILLIHLISTKLQMWPKLKHNSSDLVPVFNSWDYFYKNKPYSDSLDSPGACVFIPSLQASITIYVALPRCAVALLHRDNTQINGQRFEIRPVAQLMGKQFGWRDCIDQAASCFNTQAYVQQRLKRKAILSVVLIHETRLHSKLEILPALFTHWFFFPPHCRIAS